MQLETERLILRPWETSDAEALFEIARDPEVGPRAGWKPHQNLAESYRVIGDILIAPENYAVTLKDTGELIGSCGYQFPGQSNLPLQKDEAELGIWLGAKYWGNEYGYEASQAVIHHGFSDLGLTRIYLGVYADNPRAIHVYESCGFKEYDRNSVDVFMEINKEK